MKTINNEVRVSSTSTNDPYHDCGLANLIRFLHWTQCIRFMSIDARDYQRMIRFLRENGYERKSI